MTHNYERFLKGLEEHYKIERAKLDQCFGYKSRNEVPKKFLEEAEVKSMSKLLGGEFRCCCETKIEKECLITLDHKTFYVVGSTCIKQFNKQILNQRCEHCQELTKNRDKTCNTCRQKITDEYEAIRKERQTKKTSYRSYPISFGKFKGKKFEEIIPSQMIDYLRWLLKNHDEAKGTLNKKFFVSYYYFMKSDLYAPDANCDWNDRVYKDFLAKHGIDVYSY